MWLAFKNADQFLWIIWDHAWNYAPVRGRARLELNPLHHPTHVSCTPRLVVHHFENKISKCFFVIANKAHISTIIPPRFMKDPFLGPTRGVYLESWLPQQVTQASTNATTVLKLATELSSCGIWMEKRGLTELSFFPSMCTSNRKSGCTTKLRLKWETPSDTWICENCTNSTVPSSEDWTETSFQPKTKEKKHDYEYASTWYVCKYKKNNIEKVQSSHLVWSGLRLLHLHLPSRLAWYFEVYNEEKSMLNWTFCVVTCKCWTCRFVYGEGPMNTDTLHFAVQTFQIL